MIHGKKLQTIWATKRIRMREEELYEPMCIWLEQYLKDKYKGHEIIVVDTHSERLDRA